MSNTIPLNPSPVKSVQKVVETPTLHLVHMIFNQNEGLPIHTAHANLYMTVVSGSLSVALNDGPVETIEAKAIKAIPFGSKMQVQNLETQQLELLVVKDFTGLQK